MGVPARPLVAGNFIAGFGTFSLYYLNGFNEMTAGVKTLMVEFAVASREWEGALALLSEDLRVCLVYQGVWLTVSAESRCAVEVPESVLSFLSSTCEPSAKYLRSDGIASARTAKHSQAAAGRANESGVSRKGR